MKKDTWLQLWPCLSIKVPNAGLWMHIRYFKRSSNNDNALSKNLHPEICNPVQVTQARDLASISYLCLVNMAATGRAVSLNTLQPMQLSKGKWQQAARESGNHSRTYHFTSVRSPLIHWQKLKRSTTCAFNVCGGLGFFSPPDRPRSQSQRTWWTCDFSRCKSGIRRKRKCSVSTRRTRNKKTQSTSQCLLPHEL